jgi:hypothetical protein
MRYFISALAFLTLASLGEARPARQDTPAEETREVRIFMLDRTKPERVTKDAAAVLTLSHRSGRGKTILIPRSPKEAPAPPEGAAPGMIRTLISTPYFIELDLGDEASAPPRPAARPAPPEEAEKKADGAPAPLTAQEVLRGARKGTWFSRRVPASSFSEPFTATVTIRLGTLSFTSEEFQGPKSSQDTAEQAAARVDQSLVALRERAQESGHFMDLKPAAEDLIRNLSKLAPAGFEDVSGEFEQHRQWCLGLARNIDDYVDRGNSARVQDLSRQCEPRMKEIHSLLEQMKHREPVPTPGAEETPPTVK